ncbi:MAG: hypothetical protein AAB354_06635 [candidate division KSB1 bacterium]
MAQAIELQSNKPIIFLALVQHRPDGGEFARGKKQCYENIQTK